MNEYKFEKSLFYKFYYNNLNYYERFDSVRVSFF